MYNFEVAAVSDVIGSRVASFQGDLMNGSVRTKRSKATINVSRNNEYEPDTTTTSLSRSVLAVSDQRNLVIDMFLARINAMLPMH